MINKIKICQLIINLLFYLNKIKQMFNNKKSIHFLPSEDKITNYKFNLNSKHFNLNQLFLIKTKVIYSNNKIIIYKITKLNQLHKTNNKTCFKIK